MKHSFLFRVSIASVALSLMAACTKDVPVVQHSAGPRSTVTTELEALANEGRPDLRPLSFAPADDAKVLAEYGRESQYLATIVSFRTQLDAELQGSSAQLFGIRVVNPENRTKLATSDIYESTVRPLAALVLNPNYVGNSIYADSDQFRRILTTFNRAMVALLQSDPEFARNNGLLRDYWSAVTTGCRRDLGPALRRCVAVNFFATDYNTSRILQFLAWSKSDEIRTIGEARARATQELEQADGQARERLTQALGQSQETLNQRVVEYQQMVALAIQSRNRYVGREAGPEMLDILYLNGSVLYANYLTSLPQDPRIVRELNQHVDIARRVISQARNRLDNAEYRQGLQEILSGNNFWRDYSRRRQAEFSRWGSSLFSLASDRRLREGSGVDNAIQRSLTDVDAIGDVAFMKLVDQLRGSDPMVVNNLELNLDFRPDAYLYIVDQLFRRHWSVEDASLFWSSLTTDNPELSDAERTANKRALLITIERYMKVQIVRMIIRTNQFMARVFSDRERAVSSSLVFGTAVQESELIGNEWKNMLAQVKDLETFTKRYAKEANPARELDEYRRLESMFANMSKNISILAVYPNMLSLSFFMAKEGFSYPVQTWWGQTINLDAEIVINWLFAQITSNPPKPWFNFGNEDRPIRKYENLYSVFFTIKTGVFQTIQSALTTAGKTILINEKEFFKVVIEKFTNLDRIALRNYIARLESTYNRNADLESTLAMCREEQRVIREREAGGEPRPARYSPLKVSLEKLDQFTFAGKDFASGGEFTSYPVPSFYREGPEQSHKGALAATRVFLASSISFLNIMIDLWEKHWDGLIASEGDPARKEELRRQKVADVAEVRGSFREISDLKRRVYSKVLELYGRTRDCFDTLQLVERRQQFQLYDAEIAHLLQVHARLKQLKEFGETRPAEESGPALQAWQAELTALETRLSEESRRQSFLYRAGDVVTFDKLSLAEGYRLSKWDLMLRTANQLEAINPNLNVTRPDLSQVPELDLFRRGSTSDLTLSLPYDDDSTVFVDRVLKNVTNRFLRWSTFNATLDPYKVRLDIMLELYRARALQVYREDFTTCTPAANPTEPPRCETRMPEGEVGVNDIVNELFHIANVVNIDSSRVIGRYGDTEASYMKRIGLNRKFPITELKEFFMEDRSQRPLPIFDVTFRKLLASVPYLDESKTAVETLEAMRSTEESGDASTPRENRTTTEGGELIFLSDKDQVRSSTLEQFKPFIDGTISSIEGFAQAVRDRAQRDRGNSRRWVFEIDLNSDGRPSIVMQPEVDRAGNPIYLDPARLQDFESMQRQFHTDTKHRFRTVAGSTR